MSESSIADNLVDSPIRNRYQASARSGGLQLLDCGCLLLDSCLQTYQDWSALVQGFRSRRDVLWNTRTWYHSMYWDRTSRQCSSIPIRTRWDSPCLECRDEAGCQHVPFHEKIETDLMAIIDIIPILWLQFLLRNQTCLTLSYIPYSTLAPFSVLGVTNYQLQVIIYTLPHQTKIKFVWCSNRKWKLHLFDHFNYNNH